MLLPTLVGVILMSYLMRDVKSTSPHTSGGNPYEVDANEVEIKLLPTLVGVILKL